MGVEDLTGVKYNTISLTTSIKILNELHIEIFGDTSSAEQND